MREKKGGSCFELASSLQCCSSLAAVAVALVAQESPPPLTPPQAPSGPTPMPAVLRNYTPVTEARLRKPQDGDWLMNRRTYDGWGYSPLDRDHAGQRRPAEAGVVVLDRRDQRARGRAHRSRRRHVRRDAGQPGHRHRGEHGHAAVALSASPRANGHQPASDHSRRGPLGDKVFLAASDAVLMALDARTGRKCGRPRWPTTARGHYMSLAPLVADGKVLVGTSGGELGIRGFIAAYDPDTGKELWRTYTVPAPGEPGSETWPQGRSVEDRRRLGVGDRQLRSRDQPGVTGAPATAGPGWATSAPATTSIRPRPSPWTWRRGRSGGTSSTRPNESFDWDEVSPPILVDFQRNGRTVKGLIDVARNGYLWFLERGNGPIKFTQGVPYVRQTAFRSLDP